MSRPSNVPRPTEDAALARVRERRIPSAAMLLEHLAVAVRRRDRLAVQLLRKLLDRATGLAVPA